jgi:hypothetical protein
MNIKHAFDSVRHYYKDIEQDDFFGSHRQGFRRGCLKSKLLDKGKKRVSNPRKSIPNFINRKINKLI